MTCLPVLKNLSIKSECFFANKVGIRMLTECPITSVLLYPNTFDNPWLVFNIFPIDSLLPLTCNTVVSSLNRISDDFACSSIDFLAFYEFIAFSM